MRRVFITGGSGFVGRRLLPALTAVGAQVVALDRSGKLGADATGVQVVKADLLDPGGYREALAGCDTVLHLAAATGRAAAADHHRINAEGTRVLIDEARRAGINRFLFVSSIAVTFPDLGGYHYAQAKVSAEKSVRESGLRFLIVRPTMILGPGAPLLASLEKLALLPVAVLPGAGRALVQPIHVDDVVDCLVRAVTTDAFANETFVVGGADRLTMEQLFRRLRMARRGVSGPLVHLRLPLLQIPLGLAEAAGLGRMLPITAGQLSSFKFDGLGEPNRLQPAGVLMAPSADLVAAAPSSVPVPSGAPQPAEELDAECRVFTQYLAGQPATDYVLEKYRAAHAATPQLRSRGGSDDVLVGFARRGTLFAKLADSHAALFAPASQLRKKLVLLVAILETCPPYFRTMDAPIGGSPVPAIVRLVGTGLVSVTSLALGSIVLVPLRVFGGRKGGRR